MTCDVLHLSTLQHFVTECLGIGVVGLVLIVWGFFASASSGVVGKLATKVPRIFVMLAGFVGDAAVILFLIFWERVPSYIIVFVVSVVFGVADGVWNTIPTSEGRPLPSFIALCTTK